ncbi:MAG: Tryptophan-tRNA ligase [Candidatus Moranbacteria bacterium GW2011_GWE2_35_2-]|nr:MAG: Tryptophan-tRNA ligase [Candidatus Moranbacteria bacterium GW2011_GWE2_35_2-]KKQ05016.1 MAG: Tryptophan-tRNA ligase [Candidatus Moranbacteria bacterium GW2011_GWF1_36_4]KKQ22578.1 MAG: Tryptophan-tRNA ligase [Candidatus Moranbacteria bacterium GW2011_GWF2_37_11]KKQ28981.1 MAG: Tryptophan-tRNA ligase [Candidatus Moranbacteria bacterium GW2011_GWD1_37_17]KKQ30483.1 MAG: Tryptophan-tRNA ligase [Candidatus Moranbacteria bacterium GW2011_GWE1_37_24]KKQ47807.1 MAG: Tryptophan-tRNA ligase [Ca
MKKRIFSGIQPSGSLHIGNYLGAIKNWVDLQDSFESIFCIVDLHAITVAQNPEELRKRTLEIAKIYIASGIDPKKSAMFVQSHVSEHSEMTWILNTLARMSDLFKMTQFKDKAQKEGQENSGVGLFDYPVLMAADILLYDTEVVPVGEDQVQHIELARTLARRFNKKFGQTFVVPEASVKKETMRIMGLDDPTKKMSKSASSEYSFIGLLDDVELIKKKIKKAVTGSGSEVKYSDDEPALKNLINIFSAFSGKSASEIVLEYKGKGYADFKEGLTKVVLDFIIPFQERFNNISDEQVLNILQNGAEKVRPLAEKKIEEVKERIGFVL